MKWKNLQTITEIANKAIKDFAPPPRLTVSQWADSYRKLSPEASAEIGQWKTSRAEYLRAIMDAVNSHQKVVIMSSSQVGKSEVLFNTIGYFVHLDPCPMMLIEPTIEMAETISKDRIAPMFRDTTVLRGLIASNRSQDSNNTILHKSFKGGHLTISGANSPASLASRPIRNLLIDECDRFPFSAGREGDPIKLGIKRTATFWNRRIVIVSTPTIKGTSRIEFEYELTDKRKYFVPCPYCNEFQILTWSQVKWEALTFDGKQEVQQAWYECINCAAKITDAHKNQMIKRGQWRATAKGQIPGFHLWEIYSPWRTMKEICQDFLEVKEDKEQLKTWINTCLGESFDEQGGEGLAWQSLLARAEPYQPLSVPMKGLLLTAGVDVQADRLSVGIWAWGQGEESWLVYSIELYGDPTEQKVWEELEVLLQANYSHESGAELKISAVGIDSGFKSQEVYNFVRKKSIPNLYALKGMSTPGKPVIGKPSLQEVNYRGQTFKKGVKLWPVGTDIVKGIIYSRLRISHPGAGYIHFPIGLDPEFYEQLTAEKLVTRFIKGFPKREWIKTRPRNETLDCLVYAYAVAVALGLPRMDWNKLQTAIIPNSEIKKVSEEGKEIKPKNKLWINSRHSENFANNW